MRIVLPDVFTFNRIFAILMLISSFSCNLCSLRSGAVNYTAANSPHIAVWTQPNNAKTIVFIQCYVFVLY